MTIEDVKPLENKVLIELTKEEQKTESGLIIVEDDLDLLKQEIRKAKVLAVGPQTEDIKVGDVVAYRKRTGQDVKIMGVYYILIREHELLGIYG